MQLMTNTQLLVTKKLTERLNQLIESLNPIPDATVIFNFKDPKYSYESGGYRPVEIMINHKGHILYITEFTFAGPPGMKELVKAADFSFETQSFQDMFSEYPIEQSKVLFKLWQSNFCHYFDMGVYEVRSECF